jgi:hypothetical protein
VCFSGEFSFTFTLQLVWSTLGNVKISSLPPINVIDIEKESLITLSTKLSDEKKEIVVFLDFFLNSRIGKVKLSFLKVMRALKVEEST